MQPIPDPFEDPDAFHRYVLDELARERGADWVRLHQRELDANWEAARFILGL